MKIKIIAIFCFFIFFAGLIDLNNLFNYANQDIPNYVDPNFDNVPLDNQMNDKLATLGRVLFYDKQLSSDNQTACASCHKQDHGFGDPALLSMGSNGSTFRHSMRLGGIRFTSDETSFFWDESAATIEDLVTQPIRDPIEMGYSGTNGAPDFTDLILKMEALDYYPSLFSFAFGNETINENRMQKALAQFVRSLQSFDSKFDQGMAVVNDINQDFPNFTPAENVGKSLYLNTPVFAPNSGDRIGGGLGCGSCHGVNSFTFESEKKNNGLTEETDGTINLNITKAPSLRNLFRPDGLILGPLFHDGSAGNFADVLDHYEEIEMNNNLDSRLMSPDSIPQKLNMTTAERIQVQTFIIALTGEDIYTNEKWSDPFDENGNVELITVGLSSFPKPKLVNVIPNPTTNLVYFDLQPGDYSMEVLNAQGQLIAKKNLREHNFSFSKMLPGIYIVRIVETNTKNVFVQKVLKL